MPAFDQITLRSERLLLGPLREADAPDLFSILSDPRVMRYWSTPPWQSVDAAHEQIARDQKALATGEYLGFRKVGHLRERWIVNGEVSDTALFGLLRSDFVA
jgi:RimJ/RimL family protein N-acetyltransferase